VKTADQQCDQLERMFYLSRGIARRLHDRWAKAGFRPGFMTDRRRSAWDRFHKIANAMDSARLRMEDET
jgi:hypothetical protein